MSPGVSASRMPGGPGYGNGTGGDKGIRGTVASTGFGNGTANPPPAAKKGTLQSTGFADQTVATEAPTTILDCNNGNSQQSASIFACKGQKAVQYSH